MKIDNWSHIFLKKRTKLLLINEISYALILMHINIYGSYEFYYYYFIILILRIYNHKIAIYHTHIKNSKCSKLKKLNISYLLELYTYDDVYYHIIIYF